MLYRPLGRSDLQVSAIALGCWSFAGDANWGPQEDRDSIATVHAALDAGITLFDTAEAYGNGRSEEALGRALAGRRGQALIADKVNAENQAPAALAQACERSLRALNTEYIDLYQLHWPSRAVPLADTLGALEDLRTAGKVRAYGVCNFGVGDLADLARLDGAASNQLPYSLLWRAIEDEILPACRAMGLGLLTYGPLMQGLLTGKFAAADDVPPGRARTRHFSSTRPGTRHGEYGAEAETFAAISAVRQIAAGLGQPMALVALAWVLAQPGVTSILAGARRPEQIRENVAALDLTLPPDALAALDAATLPLKEALGPNPDNYQTLTDSRFR